MTIEERNKVVEENMPMVHYVCRHVYPSCVGPNYDDFVQVGMVALIIAADKFEDLGTAAFTTYAFACIKGTIARQISNIAKSGINLPTISMNAALDGTDDLQLEELIAQPKDEMDDGELDVIRFLETLPPHIRRTCEYRALGYTLKEIAKRENVTYQAITQRLTTAWNLYQSYKKGE